MAATERTVAERAVELLQDLPPEKQEAVLDFAAYLAERASEEAWDRLSSEAAASVSFNAVVAGVRQRIAAGETRPLDPKDL